jgi:hypothetical protein
MSIIDNGYFQNMASNYIALAIAIILGSLIYWFSRRRRLLRFFGCSRGRRIRLYLSNLDIVRGGAKDPSGLMRSYQGPSTPGYELPFIPAIFRLFLAPVPGFSDQPGWWGSLALRDVEIDASPSPGSVQDIDDSATLITVGSMAYNIVSGEIERNFEPSIRVDPDGRVTSPDGVQHEGREYAVLAKCRHPSRMQWAFYVAGPTRGGTTSAFLYLVQNWSSLRREFGDNSPFSVTIRVIDGDPSRREVVHRYRHSS